MTKPKTQRNELIIDLYNQGKSDREILTGLLKAGFEDYQKVRSVSMQVSRLRKARKIPKERPLSKIEKEVAQASGGLIKFANKITRGQERKVTKLQKDKVKKITKLQSDQKGIGQEFLPVSYRLSEDIKWAIKALAVKSRKEVSQLVREILQKYINEQNDK